MAPQTDLGLVILRVGIGGMFVGHGLPKLRGGPELWTKLGGAMGSFGVDFAPAFWGFMAALAEAGGGLCLALGIGFRPALLLLIATMIVAATQHLQRGDGFARSSHAIEAAIVFVALWFLGPGRFRLRIRGR